MTWSSFNGLDRGYRKLQESLPVFDHTDLERLVHFNGNKSRPVHRWFRFKEGFSADLIRAVVPSKALQKVEGLLLDPFCGSGTSLLSADLELGLSANRVGIEVNPFIGWVAETKLRWRSYDPARFKRIANEFLSRPLRKRIPESEWPGLTSFRNTRLFDRSRASQLVDAAERASAFRVPERDLLRLAVAASAEAFGMYRKDGRMIRVLSTTSERRTRRAMVPEVVLAEALSSIAEDLESLRPLRYSNRGRASVWIGDGRTGRNGTRWMGNESVELAVFSPPYFNHIDYTEVYKIELWLLGFVKTQREMLELRRRTVRSHASISVGEVRTRVPDSVFDSATNAALLLAEDGSKWHDKAGPLVLAYLDDMYATFRMLSRKLQPGGRAVCVVGNSAHGNGAKRVVFAVDLWLATIAKTVGLQVERLSLARPLQRRTSSPFLRESAIVVRRPKDA